MFLSLLWQILSSSYILRCAGNSDMPPRTLSGMKSLLPQRLENCLSFGDCLPWRKLPHPQSHLFSGIACIQGMVQHEDIKVQMLFQWKTILRSHPSPHVTLEEADQHLPLLSLASFPSFFSSPFTGVGPQTIP